MFEPAHIAPCGINCGTCVVYLRKKNSCGGCNFHLKKMGHCNHCRIKNCPDLAGTKTQLCMECNRFPCSYLKQMDKRYKKNYRMSLIANLQEVKETGMEAFLLKEKERWTCPDCGHTVCVHTHTCLSCEARK